MDSTPLNKISIEKLISPPFNLIRNYQDLNIQMQPNGFDMTLATISKFTNRGKIDFDNSERILANTKIIPFNKTGWLKLKQGSYLITFNEIVKMPLNIMALGKPRSSLLRNGVSIHSAVWDAGYEGKSSALLVIYNSEFEIKQNARIFQLVFFKLDKTVKKGYEGKFHKEGI